MRLKNCFGPLLLAFIQQTSAQIPSVKSFTPSSFRSSFIVDSNVQIIVDSRFAGSGSPTLGGFAQTFRSDLESVTRSNVSQVHIGNAPSSPSVPTIFLTLGVSNSSNLTLFNGKPSVEGYEFEVTERLYTIRGVEAIGAWWGTRTLLQQVVLSIANGSNPAAIPAGSGSDNPGWEIRGFMLDAGRHWFETSFLADLCIYASFFKIQEFHIHASDFVDNPTILAGPNWRDLYSGFRFQPASDSPIFSLVPELNESWTQNQFTTLQTTCSNHGVTIVPEIDTPAHSLVISKWKPELMIEGSPDLLNISFPETIPSVKSIWDAILPWFTSSEVSIGADEYDESLANDYITFVNDMNEYITSTSRKAIRIWGTNEPSKMEKISTNVTVQHWWFPGGSIPVQLMKQGFSIINSDQVFLYLDGKFAENGQFPWTLNLTLLWSGAPGGKGWAPNIFSANDPTNNTSIDNPLLRGSIMALWNDWGNNATTPLEIYYQLAQSIAVVGEKTWAGSDVRPSGLTQDEFERIYPILNAAAPGQNLNRATGLPPGSEVFSFDSISSFPLETTFESVGPPYTLSFTVKPPPPSPASKNDSVSTPLFTGLDSILYLESMTFEDPATNLRYDLGFDLVPDVFTSVEIHATINHTYAQLNGSAERFYWTSDLSIRGAFFQLVNMSFAAPSHVIGQDGFAGELVNVSLKLGD
ncbi:glycoside hydrolase family 20 protein [Collybiopsis luxurians FD-317 M1]|uniref:beta-N-acetylhexosaminidase n=1 Tax=Collybiopsis luxurians FD-317 M1 TaxID=944289 RepID=A0A0D0CR78_9AGAR|nr:glycoside hydrolase family 20 protein [Collybiopsis luxurians FD-317 M1]